MHLDFLGSKIGAIRPRNPKWAVRRESIRRKTKHTSRKLGFWCYRSVRVWDLFFFAASFLNHHLFIAIMVSAACLSLSIYLSIWSFILLLLFGFREIYILEQETLRDSKLYCLVLSSLDHSREEPPWDLQVPLPRYTNACVNLIFYLELINFMYYSFKFNYLIMD